MNINLDGRNKSLTEMKPGVVQKRVAEIAAREAARVLGIAVPEIKFFYRNPRIESLRGCALDNVIAVALDLSDTDTVSVVLHEVRHCWQRRQPEWRSRGERARERDAKCFELSWPR